MPLRTFSLVSLVCSCTLAIAQIPNAGFESWVDQGGYIGPAGWLSYNDVLTPQGYFITVESGTPGAAGAYHAVITSRTTPQGSLIQGWISAGDQGCCAGFPYGQRPEMLTGQWQYGIQPSDTGQVIIALRGPNGIPGESEMIAYGTLEMTGSIGTWTTFSVPFTYFSNATPDTAYIVFAASKDFAAPVAGSFMKVDDLAFAGTVGMDDSVALPSFNLYPSPASDVLHIVGEQHIADVSVMDVTGRIIVHQTVQAERSQLEVQQLRAGRYFLLATTIDGTRSVRSIVKE
jgi:hypothetical protein